jgi:hypothetical protein
MYDSLPSINEVPDEDVVRCGDLPTLVEEFQEIVELPVDITADYDGRVDWVDIRFLDQNLLDLLTQQA